MKCPVCNSNSIIGSREFAHEFNGASKCNGKLYLCWECDSVFYKNWFKPVVIIAYRGSRYVKLKYIKPRLTIG